VISVNEANRIIISTLYNPTILSCPFDQSLGKVLAQDIFADRNFPPFDRVMMDGIAINYQSYSQGQRVFPIEDLQAAGQEMKRLSDTSNCLEIMTGATLSENCDTVIRYEDVDIQDGKAKVNVETIKKGDHIHREGTDRLKSSLILSKGKKISAAEVGIFATVGQSEVKVLSEPRILIVSTGDELVDIDQVPLPHQIRKSNVHALKAMCANLGLKADLLHVADKSDEIKAQLAAKIAEYDVLLLSGGVSMGKLDFVPEALTSLGIEKLFHKVLQRPGKPFWFGQGNGVTVFAFPGNPVSTFMCGWRYFVPWLTTSMKQEVKTSYAVLAEPFSFKPALTYFLQVRTSYSPEGKIEATPIPGQGSGDLANLVETDAFIELPAERNTFEKGEVFPIYSFRS
jgi:molybdopterin molybdotransferase